MAVRKLNLERALQGELSEENRTKLMIELKSLKLLTVQKQVRNEVRVLAKFRQVDVVMELGSL